MSTRANPSPASDEQIRALLERYKCRVPFHEVRTRLLGNIASPVMSASPIKVVQDLWGGQLPPLPLKHHRGLKPDQALAPLVGLVLVAQRLLARSTPG